MTTPEPEDPMVVLTRKVTLLGRVLTVTVVLMFSIAVFGAWEIGSNNSYLNMRRGISDAKNAVTGADVQAGRNAVCTVLLAVPDQTNVIIRNAENQPYPVYRGPTEHYCIAALAPTAKP